MTGLDKMEVANRAKAMTEDEQILTVKMIHNDILWDELKRRYETAKSMIDGVQASMKIEGEKQYSDIDFDKVIGKYNTILDIVNGIMKSISECRSSIKIGCEKE